MTGEGRHSGMAIGIALLAGAAGSALAGATTTFEDGLQGWDGPQGVGGVTYLDPTGGNPDANLHTEFIDFGITFRNDTNPGFIQDLSTYEAVTISIDVKANRIGTFLPVSRPWVVELRDFDATNQGYPWDSVYFVLGAISQDLTGDWTTFSVTIDDPASAALPAGWGGYGDEDPNTFEPILPAGRTFADILASYDQIAFTTLQPGFFFTQDEYDVQVDNITLTKVPAPGAAALLGAAGLATLRRRR